MRLRFTQWLLLLLRLHKQKSIKGTLPIEGSVSRKRERYFRRGISAEVPLPFWHTKVFERQLRVRSLSCSSFVNDWKIYGNIFVGKGECALPGIGY